MTNALRFTLIAVFALNIWVLHQTQEMATVNQASLSLQHEALIQQTRLMAAAEEVAANAMKPFGKTIKTAEAQHVGK